jgi:hypothetical protein
MGTEFTAYIDAPDQAQACQSFIDCIRSHKHPLADENAGWSQGVTVALCNRALQEGRKITLAEFLGFAAAATDPAATAPVA